MNAAAGTTAAGPLVEARALSVRRQSTVVCHDIDLRVGAGESLGILGPNGSGKSTLLLGLRGILPSEGELRVTGLDPRRTRRGELARRVAVMPQRMEFAFPYTVEEMALLGRTPHRRPWEAFHRDDREKVSAILESVGLGHLARSRVDAISGGERRKVFLARALAQEAPVLFLDEPLAGLDPAAQEDLLHLLHGLRRDRDLTLLVVLHDVRLVPRLCDRVLGLKKGRALWQGAPDEVLGERSLEELFDTPWDPYAREGQAPVWLPRGKRGPPAGGSESGDPPGATGTRGEP